MTNFLEEKLHKDYMRAQKLDLQVGAVKFKWYVKMVGKGEVKTTDRSSSCTSSQNLAALEKNEALTGKTFTV